MTDEAEDSGCTSQDPDDAVSTGGGCNNNNSSTAAQIATANSPTKKSKPSSVDTTEVPGKRTWIFTLNIDLGMLNYFSNCYFSNII